VAFVACLGGLVRVGRVEEIVVCLVGSDCGVWGVLFLGCWGGPFVVDFSCLGVWVAGGCAGGGGVEVFPRVWVYGWVGLVCVGGGRGGGWF